MKSHAWSWWMLFFALFLIAACGCSLAQTGSVVSSQKGKPAQLQAKQVPETQDNSSLSISSDDAMVDLLLADTRGRKSGDDPIHHKSFDGIPNSSYDVNGDDADAARVLSISQPVSGTYDLMVVGNRNGKYTVNLEAVSRVGNGAKQTLSGTILKDQVKRFKIVFDAASDSPLTVSTVK